MPPRERLQTIEIWDYWTVSDLAADWSKYLKQLTGIPVTVTLQIESDIDDDGPYKAIRIHHIIIPSAWRNRLGPWKELLTSDLTSYDAPALIACCEQYLQYAPIVVVVDPQDTTSECIKIMHHCVVQGLIIDSDAPRTAPTPFYSTHE